MADLEHIRAVLFDLDETLIEPTATFEGVVCDVFDRFAHRLPTIPREDFWRTYWYKAVDTWWMMKDGVLEGDTARRYAVVNTLRFLKADTSMADAVERALAEHVIASTQPKPNAEDVLRQLRAKGLTLGIVTNGYTTIQHGKIAHNKLAGLVDFVVASEEVRSHKPHGAIFEHAIERAAAPPEAIVFVGDTPKNDIAGARAANMHSVLFDPGGRWEENARAAGKWHEPHHTIETLPELLPLLGLAPMSARAGE